MFVCWHKNFCAAATLAPPPVSSRPRTLAPRIRSEMMARWLLLIQIQNNRGHAILRPFFLYTHGESAALLLPLPAPPTHARSHVHPRRRRAPIDSFCSLKLGPFLLTYGSFEKKRTWLRPRCRRRGGCCGSRSSWRRRGRQPSWQRQASSPSRPRAWRGRRRYAVMEERLSSRRKGQFPSSFVTFDAKAK